MPQEELFTAMNNTISGIRDTGLEGTVLSDGRRTGVSVYYRGDTEMEVRGLEGGLPKCFLLKDGDVYDANWGIHPEWKELQLYRLLDPRFVQKGLVTEPEPIYPGSWSCQVDISKLDIGLDQTTMNWLAKRELWRKSVEFVLRGGFIAEMTQWDFPPQGERITVVFVAPT